jgi:hypothetical protein
MYEGSNKKQEKLPQAINNRFYEIILFFPLFFLTGVLNTSAQRVSVVHLEYKAALLQADPLLNEVFRMLKTLWL